MLNRLTFLFLFFALVVNAQVTNTRIQNESGTMLPDVVNFCPGDNFSLKVNAQASATGDYTITRISPNNYDLAAGTTPIKFIIGANSDSFSSPIDLGFDFSFYGNTYNQVVAGNNGRLVFSQSPELQNLKDNTIYKDRPFSGNFPGSTRAVLPSRDYNKIYLNDAQKELPLAQIFFGFTDLYKSTSTSTIYSFKRGSFGGVDGLLISYQNEIQNGSGGFSGNFFHSYVLLLKDGRIVIWVNNKTEDKYNALLGIQNQDASKFKVPPHSTSGSDYNNGKWKSEGVAFLFTPSQQLSPKVDWFVNGNPANVNPVPNTTFANYQPTDGDKLEATISYLETPSDSPISSSIIFKQFQSPTITATPGTGCAAGTTLAVSNPVAGATYTWQSTTNPAYSATGTSVIASSSGTYYALINGCAGAKSNDVNVTISSAITPAGFESGHSFKECDAMGQSNKDFNLSTLVKYPAGNGYTVEFLDISGAVVANAANNYMVTISSGITKYYRLKVSSTTTICSIEVPFSVSYQSLPPNGKVYEPKKLCDEPHNYTNAEFLSEFFPNQNFNVSFSTDNINFNLNQIDPHTTTPVFVKIKHAYFTCESVGKVIFQFYPQITVKPYSQFPEHCTSSTEFFDLYITKTELEYDDITAKFYTSYDATTKIFSGEITNLQYRPRGLYKVYVKLTNSDGCTFQGTPPELDLVIYNRPNLIKSTPETKYAVCGTSVFDLTTNIADYIGNWNHYAEIRYYDGNNNRLSAPEYTHYDSSVSGQPHMVFIYNQTNNLECSDNIKFDLKYKPIPTVLTDQISICGETNYSKTALLIKILGNNYNDFSVSFADGSAIPSAIPLGPLPFTISIIVKNNATLCQSGPIDITFAQGNPTSVNSNIPTFVLCDNDFDGKTIFNLNDWNPKITSTKNPIVEYFSDALHTQKIGNPTNYGNAASPQTIYGTVTTATTCPTDFDFELKVNTPTKSTTLKDKYWICYGDQIIVDAGSGNTKWLWNDGTNTRTKIFNKAGSYSVLLTNSEGCTYTHNFVISDENQPKITGVVQTNEKIEVIASGGTQPYTFYFNGVARQNPIFNPTENSYEIWVVSADGCRGPSLFLYTIIIPNTFTPNGDGKNDTWRIENLDKMQKVEVRIADRYGKLVFQSDDAQKTEWDGRSEGRALATSTYWYSVKWHDPATNKDEARSGWVLLKNRE